MTEPEKAEHATLTKERDTLRRRLKDARKYSPRYGPMHKVEIYAEAHLESWNREHGERWAALNEKLVLSDPVGR